MVLDSVSKKFGIEKSIGFGIGLNLVSEINSDSVSFRFWVSSHTGQTRLGYLYLLCLPVPGHYIYPPVQNLAAVLTYQNSRVTDGRWQEFGCLTLITLYLGSGLHTKPGPIFTLHNAVLSKDDRLFLSLKITAMNFSTKT